MMISRLQRALPLVLALFVLPGSLGAQQAKRPDSPAAGAPAQATVEGWMQEMQKLHSQLEELQGKALADPEISAQQQELGSSIKAAMEKIDPSLTRSLDRMEALNDQAAKAQQNGDQAKLQQLGAEARQIEEKFLAAQQKALEQPELAARVLEFQETLQSKMLEVQPDTEKLISRLHELEAKLTAAMQAAQR